MTQYTKIHKDGWDGIRYNVRCSPLAARNLLCREIHGTSLLLFHITTPANTRRGSRTKLKVDKEICCNCFQSKCARCRRRFEHFFAMRWMSSARRCIACRCMYRMHEEALCYHLARRMGNLTVFIRRKINIECAQSGIKSKMRIEKNNLSGDGRKNCGAVNSQQQCETKAFWCTTVLLVPMDDSTVK